MLIPFYNLNYESQFPEMNESSGKIDEFLAGTKRLIIKTPDINAGWGEIFIRLP